MGRKEAEALSDEVIAASWQEVPQDNFMMLIQEMFEESVGEIKAQQGRIDLLQNLLNRANFGFQNELKVKFMINPLVGAIRVELEQKEKMGFDHGRI